MNQTDDRPIGLFDSGIGGLTVLRALMSALPNESFVYLGDTARLPYGSKSPSTIERYLKQNVRFLCELDVKAVVVACNSASTVLLRSNLEFHTPIYNVITPGAQAAVQMTKNKKIGVLGTKATVSAQAYVKSLHQLDPSLTVYQQACPLLVPLVEEGWENDPLTNLVIYRYLQPVLQCGVDTIILGCTHYPALRSAISRVTGPNVHLVDSADTITQTFKSDLSSGKLEASLNAKPLRVMTSDSSPGFREVAARLMHPHAVPEPETVEIGTV